MSTMSMWIPFPLFASEHYCCREANNAVRKPGDVANDVAARLKREKIEQQRKAKEAVNFNNAVRNLGGETAIDVSARLKREKDEQLQAEKDALARNQQTRALEESLADKSLS